MGGDVAKVLWRHAMAFGDWREALKLFGSGAKEALPLPEALLHLLHLHSVVLSQSLSVMSHDELNGPNGPLCRHDLADYLTCSTGLAAWLAWHWQGSGAAQDSLGRLLEALLESLGKVLGQLHTLVGRSLGSERSASSAALPPETWHAPAEILRDFGAVVRGLRSAQGGTTTAAAATTTTAATAFTLLRHLPQAVPFAQRVELLRVQLQAAREAGLASFAHVKLTVRRTHLFEDGLIALANANWRAHFQVVFVNAHGQREQGQDAGGLFKEFWEKLAETAFNPEYGLFKMTESRLLYPNPEAWKYHEHVTQLFEFLGLVIGKAIFESIVVDPSFAPFFLAKLLGRHNSYYDLESLDPSLFSNLQLLKNYSGDVADLCCSFVTTGTDGQEVPLLPGGADIPVTNSNRFRYIYLLSDYKLNTELKGASEAFLSGFKRLIDERWLRMFGEDELQQVISGSQGASVDVDDLQRHTQGSNCRGAKDKVLVDFFIAMRAMSNEHRVKLLRFVTSCSRTPLLGFGHLEPPFTVHKVHVRSDSEKLPTASTCFNTLKLPSYSSWKVMKQKLEFVIVQDAGFELD
ncbi:unnamed protein product [Polarella glacialis]|uniref:HECT-type E3 ubiquitin transferase n=2 Tax=Polarella glacialis TaxID=89957 RepID=A0A813HAD5_POLGL|nr:unnamed protein product [Polarella glacialis]